MLLTVNAEVNLYKAKKAAPLNEVSHKRSSRDKIFIKRMLY